MNTDSSLASLFPNLNQYKTVTVTALNPIEVCGDWHDKPLRWVVSGPMAERSKFSTKKDALSYAASRRKTDSDKAAFHHWMVKQGIYAA
jgi:hypothetical protein